jgi:hypothetical protein
LENCSDDEWAYDGACDGRPLDGGSDGVEDDDDGSCALSGRSEGGAGLALVVVIGLAALCRRRRHK